MARMCDPPQTHAAGCETFAAVPFIAGLRSPERRNLMPGWDAKRVREASLEGPRVRRSRPRLAVLACLAIGGCVAGPNFKPPASPEASGYSAHPLAATVETPDVAGGQAQRFVSGADIPGDWWTLFHSQPLDALIDEALAHNHDLKAARAALLVAREGVLAQRGAYFPTLTAGFAATEQRQSAVLAPTLNSNELEYSLFTPQVSVSYVPDVFGLNRRTVESAQAQADADRYQMIATDLTLTTNVANAYIQAASLDAQVDATRQVVAIDAKLVDALRYQVAKGYAGGLDLAAQQTQHCAGLAAPAMSSSSPPPPRTSGSSPS